MSGGNKSRREFMKIAAGVAGAVVLTSAAKKSRGLRSKSPDLKVRPSARAWERQGK